MIRIVCPICGDEPKKGQRHICRPTQQGPPRQQVELELSPQVRSNDTTGSACEPRAPPSSTPSGAGISIRRNVISTTPGAMCASIASLISKSPGLWRSGRALARSSGEDFVAGLLATAVSFPDWHKNPKRALVCALAGRVADEAARALQDFWRDRRQARSKLRQPRKVVGGYQQLSLAISHTQVPAQATASTPTGPAPRQPGTPRNKSNPRPSQARGVPMNPIQAMKMRRAQQQQEAEERKQQSLQEAENERSQRGASQPPTPKTPRGLEGGMLRRGIVTIATQELPGDEPGGGSSCSDAVPPCPSSASTPRAAGLSGRPPVPPGSSGSDEPGGASSLPLERRAFRRGMASPRPSLVSPRSISAAPSANSSSTAQQRTDAAPDATSGTTPNAAATGRFAGGNSEARRVSSASPSAATERLRSRMQQRGENSSSNSRRDTGSTSNADAALSWKERIEMRQREAEEHECQEADLKQKLAERSCRRNDAMRRVMERQAHRQQEVIQLEA